MLRPGLLLSLLLLIGCSHPSPIDTSASRIETRNGASFQRIIFATTDHVVPRRIHAELGVMQVPENRRHPTDRRIPIRFVRFPSRSKRPGPPIVYLAGGPGASGILSASGDRFPLFMKLRDVADVIALDQRGVAQRLPCPDTSNYPLSRAADSASLAAAVEPFLRKCADHWRGRSDLTAYNTWESAEDLDDLRKALGVETISLWGISYGTHLGLAYIRQHPDRVHRAVLAGVEGPDDTYKLPSRIEEVLAEIEKHIEADRRARKAIPAFRSGIRKSIERLSKKPATVTIEDNSGKEVQVVVGPTDLRAAIYSNLGEREYIEELPARLAAIFREDYQGLARWAYRIRQGGDAGVMSITMDCASGVSREREQQITAEARSAILDDVANLRLRARCASWPRFDLGDSFRRPVTSDLPVLMISGTLDVRTPPKNAEEVLRGFRNGIHLLIDGGSHDDDLFLSSPRIAAEIMTFFRQGMTTTQRITLPPLRFQTD